MNKKYRLGLDLGTHSIGWALVNNESQKIIDGGVRIISTDNSTEDETPAALRRAKRSMRRQYARKSKRRQALIRLLQSNNMFPACTYKDLQAEKLNDELQAFFDQNPYALRAKALKEKLAPSALGRIFYHFAQRRGYYSNSLTEDEKEKGTMQSEKKASKLGMIALPQTEALIKQYGTLGNALYEIEQQHDKVQTAKGFVTKHEGRPSLRRRYTQRRWYQEEFNKIWEKQQEDSQETPRLECLTSTLKERLERILFEQRKLKSQKHLIEKCSVDPTRKRVTKYHLDVEAFAFYKTLNNIKIDGKPLSDTQREALEKKYMFAAKNAKFESVAKYLKVNLYQLNYPKESELPVCWMAYHMREIFGKALWENEEKLSAKKKATLIDHIRKIEKETYLASYAEKIYENYYNTPLRCKTIKQDLTKLHDSALKKERSFIDTGFLSTLAQAIEYLNQGYTEFKPHEDDSNVDRAMVLWIGKKIEAFRKKMKINHYSNLSLKVIQGAIPFLKKGCQEHIAIPLASLPKVFNAAKKKSWESISAAQRNIIDAEVAKRIDQNKGQSDTKQTESIAAFLAENHQIPVATTYANLYHHSEKQASELYRTLPRKLVRDLRNPTVNRVVSELRLLINAIIKAYGKPTSIGIETGRELKQSEKTKERYVKSMAENQRRNNEAKALLVRHNIAITEANIKKARLYQETRGFSIYPIPGKGIGGQIDLNKLFTPEWQIEHIVPESISFDSSYRNLTLCHVKENQKKSNRTPYQAYGSSDDWDKMKYVAERHLPYKKYQHFVSEEEPDGDNFLNRQLSDAAYIAKEVARLCRHLTNDVALVKGRTTATLRKKWGLHTTHITREQLEAANIDEDGMYYIALNKAHEIVGYEPDPANKDPYDDTVYKEAHERKREALKASTGGRGRIVVGIVKKGKAILSSKHNFANPSVRTPNLDDGSYLLAIDTDDNNALLAWEDNVWVEERKEYNAWQEAHEKQIKKIKQTLRKKGKVFEGEVQNHTFIAKKDREDHRHHLIDAITIAYTSRGYLQKVSQQYADGVDYKALSSRVTFPLPYPGLHEDVSDLLNKVLISFRQTNKHYQKRAAIQHGEKGVRQKVYHDAARGPLHDETIYGKYNGVKDLPFHVRKSIQDIKSAHVEQIVDDQIRKKIKAWFDKGKKYLPYQKAAHENPVPIKRVTLLQGRGNPIQVSRYQWALPHKKYMTIYYMDEQTGKPGGQRLSFIEAVQRKKEGKLLVDMAENQRLLCTFRINDYCIVGLSAAQIEEINWESPTAADYRLIHEHLYRVQKANSKEETKVLMLRKHCAAITAYNHEATTISPGTFKNKKKRVVKVKIDRLGRITQLVYSTCNNKPS